MPRLAAIDIGTNSVKMTIADVTSAAQIDIVDEFSEITRLGRGVDKTKSLSNESVDATLAALAEFKTKADQHHAKVLACGTSAMRDASNGEEFRKRASETVRANVEIIEGAREAKLAFLGAMSNTGSAKQSSSLILVFDVGGGSTELIVGTRDGIQRSDSLDLGAVRLTERTLHDDPPTKSQVNAARQEIKKQLDTFDLTNVQSVIGIGGTAVTLLAALIENDGQRPNHDVISQQDLESMFDKLSRLKVKQIRDIKGMEPKRADIIFAGLLIIMGILKTVGLDALTVSKRGVRHGLLIEASHSL